MLSEIKTQQAIFSLCRAYGGFWQQPMGTLICIPIFSHKCKEVADGESIVRLGKVSLSPAKSQIP